MARFLFWNLGGLVDHRTIVPLLQDGRFDVLVFAECEFDPELLAFDLSQSGARSYAPSVGATIRLRVISALGEGFIREVYSNATGRLSLRRIRLGAGEIGLAVVHLKSPVGNWDTRELDGEAQRVATELWQQADLAGLEHLCVLGDFNLQPFDYGLSSAHGFFGLMTKESVRIGERTVQGRRFRPLYNPMWGCFGDRTAGPSGTFHLKDSSPLCYDWHMLDQVLFSEGILPLLVDPGTILSELGGQTLLDAKGRPNRQYSDHLPIAFELNLPTGDVGNQEQ